MPHRSVVWSSITCDGKVLFALIALQLLYKYFLQHLLHRRARCCFCWLFNDFSPKPFRQGATLMKPYCLKMWRKKERNAHFLNEHFWGSHLSLNMISEWFSQPFINIHKRSHQVQRTQIQEKNTELGVSLHYITVFVEMLHGDWYCVVLYFLKDICCKNKYKNIQTSV